MGVVWGEEAASGDQILLPWPSWYCSINVRGEELIFKWWHGTVLADAGERVIPVAGDYRYLWRLIYSSS